MPKVEIRIGSETYTGKTTKAATAAALDHLAALFPEGERYGWAPVIFTAPGIVGVATKSPAGGWEYRLHWITAAADGSCCSGYKTRREAEFYMRRHMSQIAYAPPEGQIDSPEADAAALAIVHPDDTEGLTQQRSWLRFQREYRAARAEGLTDREAHAKACGHSV